MAADSSMTARRRTKENDGAVSARYKKNAPKDGEKKKTAAKPAEKKTDATARPKIDKEKTAKKPAGEGRASSRRTSSAAAHAAPPSPRRGRLIASGDPKSLRFSACSYQRSPLPPCTRKYFPIRQKNRKFPKTVLTNELIRPIMVNEIKGVIIPIWGNQACY